MKGKFSTSEIFFMTTGLCLVAGATYLLQSGRSFVPAPSESETDAFAASYTVAKATATPSPEPTPEPEPTAIPTPKPKPKAKPSPTPDAHRAREKSYLMFPKAHAVLSGTKVDKKGYELVFKFEVDPKNTACTFQLEYDKKVILSKKLKPSPSGNYQLKVQFKKPGKYTWQVMTAKSKSEKRDVVIRP